MSPDKNVDLQRPLDGVRFEVRDHIAYIRIDRPDRGNSLAPHMQAIFRAIWSEVRDDLRRCRPCTDRSPSGRLPGIADRDGRR